MKSHFLIYPVPVNLNYFWNIGVILLVLYLVQIVSGVVLTFFYATLGNYASIVYLIKELYFGWIMRYMHNNGASLVNAALLFHMARGLAYSIERLSVSVWISGVVLLVMTLIISYLGYILCWGQISFWGVTVILNLFHPVLILLVSGSYVIDVVCLKRYFTLHFLLPLIALVVFTAHVQMLHFIGSANPVGVQSTVPMTFTPYILVKDYAVSILFVLIIVAATLKLGLSHPDNLIAPNSLVTPAHIIPEWYFLAFYALLKIIPAKNPGFAAMCVMFLILILMGTSTALSAKRSIANRDVALGLVALYLLLYILEIWIGCQLPHHGDRKSVV